METQTEPVTQVRKVASKKSVDKVLEHFKQLRTLANEFNGKPGYNVHIWWRDTVYPYERKITVAQGGTEAEDIKPLYEDEVAAALALKFNEADSKVVVKSLEDRFKTEAESYPLGQVSLKPETQPTPAK